MATLKTRINISVNKETERTLKLLAKQDQEPLATKAGRLIEEALELEEDRILSAVAHRRLKDKARWFTHEEIWSTIKKAKPTR